MSETFYNPIMGGDRPDPALLRDGDEYWLTYSSFDSSPAISIYSSTNLID